MNKKFNLIIVDDDEGIRAFFRDVAEDLSFYVFESADSEALFELIDHMVPDVILLDLTLPDVDGVEILRLLSTRNCQASIILASGQDKRVLSTSLRVGESLGLTMLPSLQKPISVASLEQSLSKVRVVMSPKVPTERAYQPKQPLLITKRELQRAIDENELVLHYQPKVEMQVSDSFPVTGCEALVRWNHAIHGMLFPDAFIEFAENEGLIGQLTEAVIKGAIAQQQHWRSLGIQCPISINLSPKNLTDLSLPNRLAFMLDEAGIERSLLVAEITEQAAMADPDMANEILTRLRIKRIDVSLDDFGSGYSSLAEVYRMPLCELKFDRSLVRDLDQNDDAKMVIKAQMALARSLGLIVCAEGIETLSTARFLQSIGCDRGQGYYYCKPLPSKEITEYLRLKVGKTNRKNARKADHG
ncbi:EAL domain-containing protein [Cohaesibacter celericrescens]|uniref:EAL domain-containing protein n=1 Tax=Cohaesibacter celericrescens TaxID=2067669 RepID=UPI00356255E8